MPSKQEKNAIPEMPKNLYDDIDISEIVETTNMDILPKYDKIPKGNLDIARRISIGKIPYYKFIPKDKDGKEINAWLRFMEILDNGIRYSLSADSVALRRSLNSCAIKVLRITDSKEFNAETDLQCLEGMTLIVKRRQFKAKGFTQAPLQFFIPEVSEQEIDSEFNQEVEY